MQMLWHVLPLAVAVAFSTVPILAVLVILLSPNRARSALPFLIGWVGGMFLVALLATIGAQYLPTSPLPKRAEETIGSLEIVVGVALILVGIFSLWHARRRSEHALPAWLRSVDRLGPFSSLGLALVLNIRPKSLLLAIGVGLTLSVDADSTTDALVALVVYTAIGASTVVVPIIAALTSPTRAEPRLLAAREWLVRNGEVLTSIIVLAVGALIIWIGVDRF